LSVLTVIGSTLALIIGIIAFFSRKNEQKRKRAEQARKDLDNAKKNDSPSDFLDAFGGMR
jgi:Holliday junction resolvase RusA-like endonuclease